MAIYNPSSGGGSGSETLSGLTDTSISSPQITNLLAYNGSSWINTSQVVDETAITSTMLSMQGGSESTPITTNAVNVLGVSGYYSGTATAGAAPIATFLGSQGLSSGASVSGYQTVISTNASDVSGSFMFGYGVYGIDNGGDAITGGFITSGAPLDYTLINAADDSDLTIANMSTDASGNGKDVVFQATPAEGVGDSDGGNYIFRYTANTGTGDAGSVILAPEGEANVGDTGKDSMVLKLSGSGWYGVGASDISVSMYNEPFTQPFTSTVSSKLVLSIDSTVNTYEALAISTSIIGQTTYLINPTTDNGDGEPCFSIGSGNVLDTLGDKLVSFANSGTSRGYVDYQGSLVMDGGYGKRVTSLNAATYTINTYNYLIAVDYTDTGAVTITLPSAADCWDSPSGRIFKIKDTGCNCSSYNITINRAGSDTIIDTTTGNTQIVMAVDGQEITFHAKDDSTWIVY